MATSTADRKAPLAEAPLRLRPKDVSARYGISLTAVYSSIYKGELRARRFQVRICLITPEDAEDWIERCSVPNDV